MMPLSRLLLVFILVNLCCCSRTNEHAAAQSLKKVSISLGGRSIDVEAAVTEAQRKIGLMHRKRLGADEGMLFVFPKERQLFFYMKNTYVPLTVAFITADGAIVNFADMQPLDEQQKISFLPCRFALEMPQGWFARNGIKQGDRIILPDLSCE